MPFTSYSELKESVSNWLHRSDLSAVVPDFISLCEIDFNRNLRINAMESSYSSSISEPYIDIPSDLLDLKRLFVNQNGFEIDLSYLSSMNLSPYTGFTGTPQFYTEQGNQYLIAPDPDASYAYTIQYYKRIPALSDNQTTNWLLQYAPDLYLYGSLLQAAPYIKDDSRIAIWSLEYNRIKKEIQKMDDEKSLSVAGLQIRSDIQI